MTCASASIPRETWTYNTNNNTNKGKQKNNIWEQSGISFILGISLLWFPPLGRLFFITPDTLFYLRRFAAQVLMHNGWGLTGSSALWEDGGEPGRACRCCWLLLIEPGRPWDHVYEALSMQKHCTVSCLILWPTWVTCSVSMLSMSTKEPLPLIYTSVMHHYRMYVSYVLGQGKCPWNKLTCKQCQDGLHISKQGPACSANLLRKLITENYGALLVRNLFNEHHLPRGQNSGTTEEFKIVLLILYL